MLNNDFDTRILCCGAAGSPCYVKLARRSWVLREVFHGFSEEARTRGFAPLSFLRFAFFGTRVQLRKVLCQFWNVPKFDPGCVAPDEWRLGVDTVEKLGIASEAETHEEFLLVLCASGSTD